MVHGDHFQFFAWNTRPTFPYPSPRPIGTSSPPDSEWVDNFHAGFLEVRTVTGRDNATGSCPGGRQVRSLERSLVSRLVKKPTPGAPQI
jgi:hypothetical protein